MKRGGGRREGGSGASAVHKRIELHLAAAATQVCFDALPGLFRLPGVCVRVCVCVCTADGSKAEMCVAVAAQFHPSLFSGTGNEHSEPNKRLRQRT